MNNVPILFKPLVLHTNNNRNPVCKSNITSDLHYGLQSSEGCGFDLSFFPGFALFVLIAIEAIIYKEDKEITYLIVQRNPINTDSNNVWAGPLGGISKKLHP